MLTRASGPCHQGERDLCAQSMRASWCWNKKKERLQAVMKPAASPHTHAMVGGTPADHQHTQLVPVGRISLVFKGIDFHAFRKPF